MPEQPIKRALISAFDKTGVADFAKALSSEFGVEIISTGGTARLLREAGIAVTPVEKLTGFGAMLDGRVKTLHPAVHAAILADRGNPEHVKQIADAGIAPIDMVVVNLYPFSETIARRDCTCDEAIEMIDIGGPCMLRAAAKNHAHVVVVANASRYPQVLDALRSGTIDALRTELAAEAFAQTSRYDALVNQYLSGQLGATSSPEDAQQVLAPRLVRAQSLRYGENAHQSAGLYIDAADGGRTRLNQVAGPDMSYNNYLDAGAAIELCGELTRERLADYVTASKRPTGSKDPTPACVLIKHTNPCGVGLAADAVEAYRRAYLGDPNAAMGGILACNFAVDAEFAAAVTDSLKRWGRDAGAGAFFLEVWLAPKFAGDAIATICQRKSWKDRVRLLEWQPQIAPPPDALQLRSIACGVLAQTPDVCGNNFSDWRVVTQRQPTDREWADLKLAWLCVKHVKSNAIALARHGQLLAIGAGQTSRVVSCKLAVELAAGNRHMDPADGDRAHFVAASDAFFPFADGPELLMDAGATAIIQPGGSKRDEDTVKACAARGVALVMTGTRHFRH